MLVFSVACFLSLSLFLFSEGPDFMEWCHTHNTQREEIRSEVGASGRKIVYIWLDDFSWKMEFKQTNMKSNDNNILIK